MLKISKQTQTMALDKKLKKFFEDFGGLCKVTSEMKELTENFAKSIQKGGKEKKEKTDVKKQLNPYMLWCKEEGQVIRDENRGKLKPKEITELLGKAWTKEKEENTEIYKKYNKQYKQEKEERGEDVKEKKPKAKKEISSPSDTDSDSKEKKKREPSAYQRFSSAIRPIIKQDMPDLKPKEYFGEIKKRWDELSEEEKAAYYALSPKKDKVPKKKVEKSVVPEAPSPESDIKKKTRSSSPVPEAPSPDSDIKKKTRSSSRVPEAPSPDSDYESTSKKGKSKLPEPPKDSSKKIKTSSK